MKVLIKYGFIFEPSTIWTTKSSFEQDLAIFFKHKGFKPQLIETAVGQESMSIIYLEKETQVPETKLEFREEKEEKDGKSTS